MGHRSSARQPNSNMLRRLLTARLSVGTRAHREACIRWISVVLCCGASLLAQDIRPDHIGKDVIGETADEYIDNNHACAFLSDPAPSPVQPRQTERTVLCVSLDDRSALYGKGPDTAYKGIPLKTLETTFLAEDGLVSLTFEVDQMNYDQLKQELLREFRLPDEVLSSPDEVLTWDNGTSRIDLQEGDPNGGKSHLFLHQDAYLVRLIMLEVVNGGIGADKVQNIDKDYVLLQGPDGARIKIKMDSR